MSDLFTFLEAGESNLDETEDADQELEKEQAEGMMQVKRMAL